MCTNNNSKEISEKYKDAYIYVLEQEVNYWKREAIKNAAKLGEIKILMNNQKVSPIQ